MLSDRNAKRKKDLIVNEKTVLTADRYDLNFDKDIQTFSQSLSELGEQTEERTFLHGGDFHGL